MSSLAEAPRRSVVVTGLGAVSPLGMSVPTMWKTLLQGKSGISSIEYPHTNVSVAGVIPDELLKEAIDNFIDSKTKKDERSELRKDWKNKFSRPVDFAVLATAEALRDAGLSNRRNELLSNIDQDEIGIYMATGFGAGVNLLTIESRYLNNKPARAYDIFNTLVERVATVPSMVFKLRGPISTPVMACASSGNAIIDAARIIAAGEAKIMVAGGAEASINSHALGAFEAIKAASTNSNPDNASRPFDKEADGFVMGEGAAALILEDEESARQRGAAIYARVSGWGQAADAHHDTAPGDGQTRAIRKAMRMAGLSFLSTDEIVYVNAHATSTMGDGVEIENFAKALNSLGNFIKKSFVVGSTKAQHGHLIGAAGAIEAVITVKALERQTIPPSRNITKPIDEIEKYGINLAPLTPLEANIVASIDNSFGFGGGDTSVVFKPFEG